MLEHGRRVHCVGRNILCDCATEPSADSGIRADADSAPDVITNVAADTVANAAAIAPPLRDDGADEGADL